MSHNLIKPYDELIPKTTNDIYCADNIFSILNKKKEKILIVGEVQSGKTQLIFELIASAFNKYQYDIIVLFGGTTLALNSQTRKRLDTDHKKNSQYSFVKIKNLSSKDYYNNNKVIYVDSKENNRLSTIETIINDIPNLNEKKLLIIDDESDYGTINTKTRKAKPGKYYTSVNNIFKKIKNGGFIGITATPYANLMSNKNDFPFQHLFAFPSKTEYGYTGISYFNKLKNFYINIENYENFTMSLNIKTQEFKKILFAYCIWIINTIHLLSLDIKKSDFLINNSYKIKNHLGVSNAIENIIEYSKNRICDFTNILIEISKFIGKEIKENEINLYTQQILPNIKIQLLNSQFKNDDDNSNFNIFIGGVLLSRGITYDNLTTELILNLAKGKISVDVILQAARWFGYRTYKSKYMNVITTKKCIDSFFESEKYNDLFFLNNEKGKEMEISKMRESLYKLDKESINVQGCSNAKK